MNSYPSQTQNTYFQISEVLYCSKHRPSVAASSPVFWHPHSFSLSSRCRISAEYSKDDSKGLFLCPSEPASARFGPAFFFKPCLCYLEKHRVSYMGLLKGFTHFQALVVRGTGWKIPFSKQPGYANLGNSLATSAGVPFLLEQDLDCILLISTLLWIKRK